MISAILLCIGQTKRREVPSALLQLNAKTMVRHSIDELLKSGVGEIIVVTTDYQKEIETEVRKYFDSLVRFEKIKFVPHLGRVSEVKALQSGVTALDKASTAFFISHADYSLLENKDYSLLLKYFVKTEQKIARARFKNTPCYPFLISKKLQGEILMEPSTQKDLEFLFRKYADQLAWLETSSRRGLMATREILSDEPNLLDRQNFIF